MKPMEKPAGLLDVKNGKGQLTKFMGDVLGKQLTHYESVLASNTKL